MDLEIQMCLARSEAYYKAAEEVYEYSKFFLSQGVSTFEKNLLNIEAILSDLGDDEYWKAVRIKQALP